MGASPIGTNRRKPEEEVTPKNLVRSYLLWKVGQSRAEYSPYSSLFKGHFLVEVKCSLCGKERFSFEEFAELSLDVCNLERNQLLRKNLRLQFESQRKGEDPKPPAEFGNTLSVQFRSIVEENPSSTIRRSGFREAEGVSKGTSRESRGSRRRVPVKVSRESNGAESGGLRASGVSLPDLSEERLSGPGQSLGRTVRRSYPNAFLRDLIEDFFAADYVQDYFCGACQRKTLVRKTYRVLREPEVLTLSLKRFVFYPRIMKVDRPVFLQDYAFDMEAYLYRPEEFLESVAGLYESTTNFESQARHPDVSYNRSISFNRSMGQRRSQYEMVAYIEHSGGMDGGHYVAFTRDQTLAHEYYRKKKRKGGEPGQDWFLQNDQKVFLVKNHDKKLLMYNIDVYSIFYKKTTNAF